VKTPVQILADVDRRLARSWLKLPTGTDAKKLQKLANEAGVAYVVGAAFMPNGGGEEYIRLAFSYETPEALREGTALVCKAIHEASS